MKQFTIKDIRSWDPCYDPNLYLQEDWKGTVLDILNKDEIPFKDRLWVVLRTELLSKKLMRLFSVHFAREAVNVAERYVNGNATEEELDTAYYAACYAKKDKLIEMIEEEGK